MKISVNSTLIYTDNLTPAQEVVKNPSRMNNTTGGKMKKVRLKDVHKSEKIEVKLN